MSSLSSVASTSQMSSTGPSPLPRDAPIYEQLIWSHQYDPKSQKEVALNRRVGFYKFKSDLGAGNFSKVKLAQHQLTRGINLY
jgi:serine/threonine-protein kinase NIM1